MTTAIGSELLVENPGAPTIEYIYGPSGEGLTIEHPSGAYGEMLYGPQGSEVSMQSGTPTIVTTLGTIPAQGSEVTTEYPNSYDVFMDIIPDGTDVTMQSGTPIARVNDLVLVALGSEYVVQSGTPVVNTIGLQLLPLGSELALQSGTPILPLLPLGYELLVQSGVPALAGPLTYVPRRVRWRASYLFLVRVRVIEGEYTTNGGDMVELVPNNTTRLELAVTVPQRGTATPATNLSLTVRVAAAATATAALNVALSYEASEYLDDAQQPTGTYSADVLGTDIADALTNSDADYDTPYVLQVLEGTSLMASAACIFRRWRGL